MKAGTLDKRITIQQKTLVPDGWGDSTAVWATFATVWANIRHMNGKEFIAAGAEAAQSTASIRIRKLAGVTTSMRVLHGADIYNINAVLPGPNNVFIDLAVTAGVNEG